MPDPTLESVLLQKAQRMTPGPMSQLDNYKQSHPNAGDVKAEIPIVPELDLAGAAENTLAQIKRWRDYLETAGGEATEFGDRFIRPWLANANHVRGSMIEQGLKDAQTGPGNATWISKVAEYLKSPSAGGHMAPATESLGHNVVDEIPQATRAAITFANAAGDGDTLLKYPADIVRKVLGGR